MNQRQLKIGYFILEGLNAFSTTYFYNYLFFQMHTRFGTGSAGNLSLSALNGLVYMVVVGAVGHYAKRIGYHTALRIGFAGLALAMVIGSQLTSEVSYYFLLAFWTSGLCFTWPTLEALVSENETRSGLQRMVGIYNMVWATGSAAGYFLGGALLKSLGPASLYWLAAGMHILQLALLQTLQTPAGQTSAIPAGNGAPREVGVLTPALAISGTARPAHAGAFLRIAWLANPFAYVAINSLIPVIPEVASRLNLSLVFAGFFCSIWYFARMGAFLLLWLWPGWHYRFRWLLGAYVSLIVSFLALLLVPHLWVVIVAQIVFGFAVGLSYYSSLYYSMDVGDASSSHGGFHEAAIGAGVFSGPAVGAVTLYLWPQYPRGDAWAVSGLLVLGGFAILAVRSRMARPS